MTQERVTQLMEYDPNNDEDLQLWGSYVPDRTTGPDFKLHPRQFHAASAARLGDGAVYWYCNGTGRWELHEVWVNQKEVFRR